MQNTSLAFVFFCDRKLASADVAVFGGINFGDRFGSWRDFAIRLEGDAVVSELLSSLGWQQVPQSSTSALFH